MCYVSSSLVKLNSVYPLKVVIHLTDGLDAPIIEMQNRVEELRLSGKREHKIKMGLAITALSNCLSSLKILYM